MKELDDKEIRALLNELEDDDEDMRAAEAEIETDKNEEDGTEDSEEDSLSFSALNRWQKANEASLQARRMGRPKIVEERKRIQREAFDQDILPLSAQVSKSELRLLISLVVKKHTDIMEKYHKFINAKVTKMLSPRVPKGIKLYAAKYPQAIRYSPGFLYTTSEETGGISFWVTPKIPYVLKQGTEVEALKQFHSPQLHALDEAIAYYHRHLVARQEKEVKCASTLLARKIKTYYDILRLNPFWFDALYQYQKSQIDG